MYQVQVMRGLLNPHLSFNQLQMAEAYKGFKYKVVLLMLLSTIIFTISAVFGVGTGAISDEIIVLSLKEYEARLSIFILGKSLAGLIYAAVILFIPSLLFWALSPIPYRKLVILQLVVLLILLFEKVLVIPMTIWLGVPWYSSPLSLGVIGQAFTNQDVLIYFLGSISLIKGWAMVVQYKGLKRLNEDMNPRKIVGWVVAINVLFWLISALLTYIDFTQLI